MRKQKSHFGESAGILADLASADSDRFRANSLRVQLFDKEAVDPSLPVGRRAGQGTLRYNCPEPLIGGRIHESR